jgi:hypothetical protein
MKTLRIAAVLVSILAVSVAAQNAPAGRWRAVFASPADQFADFNEVILTLDVDGTKLTGTADVRHSALASEWPGAAMIAEGKLDGDRFSFTWTGPRPSSGGYPHMKFTGTVDGDGMKLTALVGGREREMKVERLPSR